MMNGQKRALCYVLMPFSHDLRDTYQIAIKSAVADAAKRLDMDIACVRGDEIVGPGSITREIVNSIYRSDVIIADLTDNNPNVFYEMGIAHCMGNKTIMITQNLAGAPFDVHTYRLLKYEASPDGLTTLQSALACSICEVLSGGARQASNPVEDFVPIRYTNVVIRLQDLMTLESHAASEVWLIEPSLDSDLKLFRNIIKENVEKRSVNYRFLIPNTKSVLRSAHRLRETLALTDDCWKRIAVRVIDQHVIESEVVIYDAYTDREQVFLMSSPEEDHPFWFRIRGSRALAVRERYEALWQDASHAEFA